MFGRSPSFRVWLRAVLLGSCACAGVFLSGCATFRKAVAPRATLSLSGGGKLEQSGDAQVPAKLAVSTSTNTLPLPSGSDLVFDQKLGTLTLRLSHDSTLKTETREEKAEAPQAFTPPAPPTPKEEASGRMHIWFSIGLVIGVAAGLFGLVRGWDMVMYGGACVAGACAFALFVETNPIVFILIGVGLALKVAGPTLWHSILKKLPQSAIPAIPPPP